MIRLCRIKAASGWFGRGKRRERIPVYTVSGIKKPAMFDITGFNFYEIYLKTKLLRLIFR